MTNELEAGVVVKEGSSFADIPDPASLIDKYVPPNKRPRHRIGFLGLWGRKVDTIEWCTVCWTLLYYYSNHQLMYML